MSDSPFDQSQETWLFTHFMRKHGAQIWLGIITLMLSAFVVFSGYTVSVSNRALVRVDVVSDSLVAHNLAQARREGTIDATLNNINATLARIEQYMSGHK